MMHFRVLISLALVAVLCGQTPAQPPAGQPAPSAQTQAPPIKVQGNEVIVPVTVTDEKGKFVTDLDQADFRIFDEGKEQKIKCFTRERSQPEGVRWLCEL